MNGKVIHLVQRPPPGPNRGSSSSNTDSPSTDRHRNNDSGRNNVPFIHVLDGTVLGAMAIPMNTNSGVSVCNQVKLLILDLLNNYSRLTFPDYSINNTFDESVFYVVHE